MKESKACHDFLNIIPDIQFDYSFNPYLGVYYAEDKLYIVKDCMVDCYYFQIADSCKDAIDKVISRIEEAMKAGAYHDEDIY